MQKITTFLMFDGNAEAAMNLYISLFEDSEIKSISRYGEEEAGAEGTLVQAVFSLNGQLFICVDSSEKRDFGFTPAISLQVTCTTEKEIDYVYSELAKGGEILIPLNAYPFNKKYSWVNDRYGVSWQLMLADVS